MSRRSIVTTGGPRLLIVNTTNRRRGAELRSLRIAGELESRGWTVDLASLTDETTDPTIEAVPLTGRRPEELGRMNLDVAVALRRAIAEGSHDLVLANGSATLRYVGTAGRLAAPRRRLGYVAIGDPSYWATTASSRRRMRLLLRTVGWVIAVSHATARQIRAIAGPSIDVEVVHGGVPSSFLEIDRPPRDGPLRLVFIGSLSKEKDPEAAVEALAASGADAVLRLVGGGPLTEQVSDAAARLGIEDRVELVGARADVTADLAWAHALVLTSRTEGLPGVVLEAGAAGLPTLAFAAGGTTEVVDDGVTGRVVVDRAALASAIAELAAGDEMREQWGANARAMVRDRWLLEHAADRYDRALRRRLNSKRG